MGKIFKGVIGIMLAAAITVVFEKSFDQIDPFNSNKSNTEDSSATRSNTTSTQAAIPESMTEENSSEMPSDNPEEAVVESPEVEDRNTEATEQKLPPHIQTNELMSSYKKLKMREGRKKRPRDIFPKMKGQKNSPYVSTVYCKKEIPVVTKMIKVGFKLENTPLSEVLFLAVNLVNIKNESVFNHFYVPRNDLNLVEFPNNFPRGRYNLQYGFVLLKEGHRDEVPFYSKTVEITIK